MISRQLAVVAVPLSSMDTTTDCCPTGFMNPTRFFGKRSIKPFRSANDVVVFPTCWRVAATYIGEYEGLDVIEADASSVVCNDDAMLAEAVVPDENVRHVLIHLERVG
jgi:hypothetical protein